MKINFKIQNQIESNQALKLNCAKPRFTLDNLCKQFY